MLIAAAAKEWNVPADQCTTANGMVKHTSGKQKSYGELAASAAETKPAQIRLKAPAEFKLIGHPEPRTDAKAKVDGSAQFGIDAHPAGMLFAALKLSPVIGGKIKRVDQARCWRCLASRMSSIFPPPLARPVLQVLLSSLKTIGRRKRP
jgi:isoquinoline 1-oxidoreductase beta subunit